MLQGDLGQSILHARPVGVLVADALPRTVYLAVAGMLFALALSLPLGIFAAVKRKSWVDYLAQVSALIGLSLPSFWAALLLMLYFGLILGWFPIFGYKAPGEDFGAFLQWKQLFDSLKGTTTVLIYEYSRDDKPVPIQVDESVCYSDEHDLMTSHIGVYTRKE